MGEIIDFARKNRARDPSNRGDLFRVIADMEDYVRSADQLAAAISTLIERGPNFSDRDWQALSRVVRELEGGTVKIAAAWECAFELAKELR
jgi:hypothetical protein